MAILAIASAVRHFAERHLANGNRSPGQLAAFAALGIFLAAIAKYPDRAIFVRARPDLKKKTVPGHPLVGNMIQALTSKENPLYVLKACFDEYGDLYTLTIPGRGRIFVVNNPEFIEHILKTNFDNYIKGEIFSEKVRDFFGEGIFVLDGDDWRFHRRAALSMFTTKLYREVTHGGFTTAARNLCAVLDKHEALGKPAELQELLQKMTMDAFGKVTFGLDINSLQTDGHTEFGDAFDFLVHNIDSRVSNPLWKWTDPLVPGKVAKIRHSIQVLDKNAYTAIETRKQESEKERERRPKDLLDHCLTREREDGTIMSDVDLRNVFVGFMIAGRDTTAFTLTWEFYSLMANPRVMKNVLKELDVVLQGSEEYAYEIMMNELPYLKAVFHETLRLYPPAPRNIREAVNDDVLPDGTPIYKGDKIAFSPWCMGRNRSVWGEDAEVFVPERWLVEDSEVSSHAVSAKTGRGVSPFGKFRMENQYKFNSFNAGPRLCLGQTFATVEAMVASCMLLQNFELKLVPGQPLPEPLPSGALPMKGGLLVLVKRKRGSSLYTPSEN